MRTFYMLRHVPTKKCMPARMTKTGRAGWSWWDPFGDDSSPGVPDQPRLFTTKAAVKNAASMWLKGTVQVTRSNGYDDEGGGDLIIRADKRRQRRDLEFVPVELVEKAAEAA